MSWPSSRIVPPLEPEEVQVWRLFVPSTVRAADSVAFSEINDADAEGARLEALITDEEGVRRDRFRQADDRRRFARARGLLRALLSHQLDRSPSSVAFVAGPSGKPALPPSSMGTRVTPLSSTGPSATRPPLGETSGPQQPSVAGPAALRFNVSHSHEWVLIALAWGREVGVDVEHQRPRARGDLLDLARRFFSPREVAALEALPAAARDAGFYRTWACKESLVKGIGKGLSVGLDRFSVIGAPEGVEQPELRWEPAGKDGEDVPAEALTRWTIQSLPIGPEYAAAVAVEGHAPRPTLLEWR